ncbi:MAG TPA: hypothetical protein VNY05_15265 [Candidatus Acidoferrales bacterium]|nr:hypothetical protein [Candidatus Acidoferrales bacterium]
MPSDKARTKTAAAALALFALNALITLRLFHVDYTRQMGSIEGAYIGLARYVAHHLRDLSWFPLWYGGIPYPDTYPPLLHWISGLAVATFGISPGLAYHAVTATIYAAGPAALFWMAWRLSGNRAAAFSAGLLYSLISPSCLLVKEVRFDAGGWFGPRRLGTLVIYGEGPHLTSLLWLPLAIGLLHVALQKRRPAYYVMAALAIAAVALSNWLGAVALAMAIAAYLLAGAANGATSVSEWLYTTLRTAGLGAFAYAIAVPWLGPATIAVIRANAPRVANNFESTAAQRLFAAAVALGLLLFAWILVRWKAAPATRFAALFSYITAATALGRYWFRQSLVPQPERYHLEMDMAFCVLASFLLWPLAARMVRGAGAMAARAAICAAAVACIAIAVHQQRLADEMERPIDIRTTIEYQTARWLDANLPGRRVFAPGTIGFWLNAFSDAPQLTGGFDNGILNPFLPHVIYQVYAGDKQDLTVVFLKAYGCAAVIGGGPESREVYHPYAHPEKFHGLPALWRNGGDAVYAVPGSSGSLAHAVRAADLVQMTPVAYNDVAVKPYLAALDDPSLPVADLRWRAPSAATIAADLRPEHLLSIQISWTAGWHAFVNGEPRRAWGDKLNQMVVEPRCSGACTVELTYDGGAEGRVSRWLSRLALAAGALWIAVAQLLWRKHLWRKRSDSPTTN